MLMFFYLRFLKNSKQQELSDESIKMANPQNEILILIFWIK